MRDKVAKRLFVDGTMFVFAVFFLPYLTGKGFYRMCHNVMTFRGLIDSTKFGCAHESSLGWQIGKLWFDVAEAIEIFLNSVIPQGGGV